MYSRSSVFADLLCGYVRCSVDGRPNRNNKVAFPNSSGIVWMRPNSKGDKQLQQSNFGGEVGGILFAFHSQILTKYTF